MKTLFVVSGGDAPGINMALAHYTALAEANRDSVMGAKGGFAGLFQGNIIDLATPELTLWSGQPGSYLPSSREPVLSQPDARTTLLEILAAHQIDSLVLFGGNGTFKHVLPLMADWNVACVGLPTTIDNDIPGTERTLGFDSACNFAYQAIDGIMATAHALPGRIFMVETLGGNTGFLALEVALGARADIVLMPEYESSPDWLHRRLIRAVERQGYALIVLSEGVENARTLADQIFERTSYRVRDVRLGHAQRGARPSHIDRTLAVQMAQITYDALRGGVRTGKIVVQNNRVIVQTELTDSPARMPDRVLYDRINGLSADGELSR